MLGAGYLYIGSYGSKLTGACYGNVLGIGGLGGYCVCSGYGVARARGLAVVILQKLANPTF